MVTAALDWMGSIYLFPKGALVGYESMKGRLFMALVKMMMNERLHYSHE